MQNENSTSQFEKIRTEKKPFEIQKKSIEYYQPKYLKPNRMSSYGYQLKLAMDTNGSTFLNIGSGNEILSFILKKNNKYIIDLDIDINTYPDVCAVFPKMPFAANSFDVVMCFQVIEHMPFSMFKESLRELIRVSREFILVSLPDMTRTRKEIFKYKIFHLLGHPKEWMKFKPRSIDKEHFWEIGNKDITREKIVSVIEEENISILNSFYNELNPYHYFFIIEKN